MKHFLVYVTPDQTVKTIAKFYGRETSQSLEPQPSSCVIVVPILKVMSLKTCVSMEG